MPPVTPPLVFDHQPGQEISIKYKETIYQFYNFAKIPIKVFIVQYKLKKFIIVKILEYKTLEYSRIIRTGKFSFFIDR
jgi:hypothetical protein